VSGILPKSRSFLFPNKHLTRVGSKREMKGYKRSKTGLGENNLSCPEAKGEGRDQKKQRGTRELIYFWGVGSLGGEGPMADCVEDRNVEDSR